jgi:hypothetical protein
LHESGWRNMAAKGVTIQMPVAPSPYVKLPRRAQGSMDCSYCNGD